MEHDVIRANLAELIRTTGESYASISTLLGRNRAYVQQYIKRGTPSRLDDADRILLARYFRVDQTTLGKPDEAARPKTVQVPRLGVQASAGLGATVDGEFAIGTYGFDSVWLRRICRANFSDLSIIQVTGDSMTPTLMAGDDVLVDRSDAGTRLRDGVYVLRREDMLMVKRLALAPTGATLTITSDNPAYPSWPDCPLTSVDVVGRVVWAGRTFG